MHSVIIYHLLPCHVSYQNFIKLFVQKGIVNNRGICFLSASYRAVIYV